MNSLELICILAAAGTVGSGLFAGAEMGLLSLDALRVRSMENSTWRGRMLGALVSRRRGLLITTILMNNLFLVSTSVLVTGVAIGEWGKRAAPLVTLALTALIFFFGEVLPKALFRRHADAFMKTSSLFLLGAHFLLRPLTAVAALAVAAAHAPFRGRGSRRALISREGLRRLLAESTEEEAEELETPMLARVLKLRSTVARQVMIPLARVISVPENAPSAAVIAMVRSGGPTRLPVYRGSPGRIVGLVNVFDLLFDPRPKPEARHYLRGVHYVRETHRTDELLAALGRTRSGMAVVVDRRGGAMGIVTVEDLVEEIVGELADEHEPPVPAGEGPRRGVPGTGRSPAG